MKPVGSIDLKRVNRTFWMDLPRAESGGVQRIMALRNEQHFEQVEQIAGNLVIEEKSCKTMKKHQGHENHHLDPVEELDRHE